MLDIYINYSINLKRRCVSYKNDREKYKLKDIFGKENANLQETNKQEREE